MLGTKNLAEILSERETISHIMQSSLDEATDPWGVKVERVEMWVMHSVWKSPKKSHIPTFEPFSNIFNNLTFV